MAPDADEIAVRVGEWRGRATLLDRNPENREALLAALPFEATASRWGDEVYADVDASFPAEETAEEVVVGTVATWPAGDAVCVFWGPTPASTGDEPRAAGPVNPVAQLETVEGLDGVGDAPTLAVRRP